MKKSVTIFALSLALIASPAFAHHPAVDMVDEEIYAMIDALVADTPHAEMFFDDDMGTTTIETDSVSAAEELIDDGLLATLSLLDDEVTVTITFAAEALDQASSSKEAPAGKTWEEGQDWGGAVIIMVDSVLLVDEDD